MKRLLLLPVLAIALSGLSACGGEKEAEVKETATSTSEAVDSSGDEADESASEEEDVATTANIGDVVEVGDWDVKITKVVLDANSLIAKANTFNDKPSGQYVLVNYEATYTGSERTADIDLDLTWSLTGADQQVNDIASQVTPLENEEAPTSARKGGTVKADEVFDVPAEQLSGAILTVESYDENFEVIYADFALN